ncbi:MAG: CRISPR-associated endonuclease Cas2 [Microgenomates group bacterium]
MMRSYQKNKKQKISFKDFVLLVSSKLIDIYEEIRDPFNLISSYYHYNRHYFQESPPKINIKKLNNLYYDLKKQGYIIKKQLRKKNYKFILTQKSNNYLKTKYPQLYFSKNNWDKKIRIVIFDIQELNRVKRNQFRRILKQLGFIMLQKSVWVSPFDQFHVLKNWLKENKINEKVLLIEGSKTNIKNNDKLINQFWTK